jgi:Asp-tRNA(Asn)/Glu-tRNA(Gln) amidotransferase A subunit family amidase
MKQRRQFLINAPLGLLAVADAVRAAPLAQDGAAPAPATPGVPTPGVATPGAPPTFGATAGFGPAVTPATFAEAEKLVQVRYTPAQRAMMAGSWRVSLSSTMERRSGPRTLALAPELAPATVWRPLEAAGAAYGHTAGGTSGSTAGSTRGKFVRSRMNPGPLPTRDEDIAYAPVTRLARWIETRAITAERLTGIYIARIKRLDGRLRSVITLTEAHALAQARQADRDIAAGKYRGPLHGIPYGVKDLLDTAGIRTTWGAEFHRERVPQQDAAVVARLNAAGAVLVAKLSLGALALNDIWFGGQTMNPWLPEEGASGSSAGPGAATAAALVAFSIGSETGGSIVSPAMRCGVTGLRPTYGRVPRTGAMTLCWSLDKLGPMTRSVEDAMLVLQAISGVDAGDAAGVEAKLDFDAGAGTQALKGLKVGYFPAWMQEAPATEVDRAALESLKKLGLSPVPVTLPDWPYQSLNTLLFAEAAAAFEDITLDGRVDQLKAQVPDAWPNLFRQARFLSAVDFVQADRLRRKVAQEMARVFRQVDLLLVPSLREEMLTISNNTGHPSLTLRTGSVEVGQARSDWAPNPAQPLPTFDPPRRVPHGVTLIGRLFDEGTIARVGLALEKSAGVSGERPPGF